jgi:UDP-N-acetylglucosamine transferase subunit ALG13
LVRSSSDAADAERPLVVVTVGTDHHPFDRLVRWVDTWASDATPRVKCFVQTGTSTVTPRVAEWAPYVSRDELRSLMSNAAAVACHGGPATIMDSRRAGVKPVVVPRRRALGEHVDDHQVLFARRAARAGDVDLVESEEGLRAILDVALSEPSVRRIERSDRGDLAASIRRFKALADPLLGLDVAPRSEAEEREEPVVSRRRGR